MSSIHIVGSGVVGTATGMGLVAHDHDVTFLDVRQERVDALRAQGRQAKLVGKEGAALPDFVFVAVSAPTTVRL